MDAFLDGRKCVDGKLVETKEWTPEKCWAELIIGKRMVRKSLRKISRIESMKRRQKNVGNEKKKMKKKICIERK